MEIVRDSAHDGLGRLPRVVTSGSLPVNELCADNSYTSEFMKIGMYGTARQVRIGPVLCET